MVATRKVEPTWSARRLAECLVTEAAGRTAEREFRDRERETKRVLVTTGRLQKLARGIFPGRIVFGDRKVVDGVRGSRRRGPSP